MLNVLGRVSGKTVCRCARLDEVEVVVLGNIDLRLVQV
jgi:hypothetical protein